jgi:hypothetical protein
LSIFAMSPCCPVGSSAKLASDKNWQSIDRISLHFASYFCAFSKTSPIVLVVFPGQGDDVTMVEVSLTWSTLVNLDLVNQSLDMLGSPSAHTSREIQPSVASSL